MNINCTNNSKQHKKKPANHLAITLVRKTKQNASKPPGDYTRTKTNNMKNVKQPTRALYSYVKSNVLVMS